MRIDVEDAQSLAEQMLMLTGAPADHAEAQAAVLVDAESRQVPSHGLLRLPRLIRRICGGVCDPRAVGEHHWDSETSLRVDGQQGLGPPVALRALDAIVGAADRHGVACAAVTGSNHLGMIGFYARRVAAQGMVCLAFTTSEALVHPWGGTRAMIGTNPLAIGVPADPEPLVVDMATSVVSMGKIHDYARRGLPLEPDWALDADGNETLDAAAATLGSIAPFGGAKGYALGLSLGAMVSFVTGSAPDDDVHGTLDDDHHSNKGDLFVVLRGAGRPVTGFLDRVRATAPRATGHPVTVPGDRSHARHRRSADSGIDIDDRLWAELVDLRDSLLITTASTAQPEREPSRS